ncbi:acetylglutamate kinase [Paenibacillus koleovorans]|uniref:acetylglutamate kinase n=1 Tax=Paenibacillus koleovorans TaxID=121608 RepID=UPI001C3F6423|nr:acetylglutamate kinase [Paenibacillus koleovorans]
MYWNSYYGGYGLPVEARACISERELQLRQTMRRLWEDHSAWTRMTIISIVSGLPDEAVVTKRLLRNPIDMANALQPFYGQAFAARFGQLMTEHLTIAAQLVKAAKAGKKEEAAKLEKDWYHNADQIAALLAQVNPYFNEQDWRRMLHEHLRLVKEEAVLRLTGDYVKDIANYDVIVKQALEMADSMSAGILMQFPHVFR